MSEARQARKRPSIEVRCKSRQLAERFVPRFWRIRKETRLKMMARPDHMLERNGKTADAKPSR